MPKNAKTLLKLPLEVQPSGNPFVIDEKEPATVPIPQCVLITKIEGAYTERDRKLWVFLVHAVWDDLLEKQIHEIHVAKINKVFRSLGGDNGFRWIWDSVRKLRSTHIDFEYFRDGEWHNTATNLMNAQIPKDVRANGKLYFEIPRLLALAIKQPSKFSRLRLHFMIGLSGKYAVTLYELLEGVANMKSPVLDVPLVQLRQWLKVPDGKLERYIDLKRRVIDPALKQINENPEGAGFSVTVEPVKEGRAVERLRFVVSKSTVRVAGERGIKEPRSNITAIGSSISAGEIKLLTETYERAKAAAPGYDVYFLETEWREYIQKNGIKPNSPDAAFVGFCKKKAKEKPLR